MLHILWLIIKFILILLGILLGLVLLAVLLILFCPVRYKACVVKEQDDWRQVTGQGCVSWLFHGVSLKAEWRDGELETFFHLFGIPVSELLKKRKQRKSEPTGKKNKEAEIKSGKMTVPQKKTVKSEEDTANQTVDTAEFSRTESEQEIHIKSELPKQTQIQEKPDTEESESPEKKQRRNPFSALISRIKNFSERIRSILRNIRSVLKKITGNVSWWKEFLEHPRVKAAISLVWKNAKFLLRHVLPTKTEGTVTFSCEDPAVTGSILAVLGMTIPFHKNCVEIIPLFQGENSFRGNISVRGRIYGFVFVRAAIVIYFNKNIKYVIKRWKTRRA